MQDLSPFLRMISAAADVEWTVLSPSGSTRIASAGIPRRVRYSRPTSPSVKDLSPPAPPVVNTRGASFRKYNNSAWLSRASKTGDAFTLVTEDDVRDARSIERYMGMTVERKKIEGFPYVYSALFDEKALADEVAATAKPISRLMRGARR